MQATANHVKLRHQLNDELQVEQVYTCYLDTDRCQNPLVLDACSEAMKLLVSKHQDSWTYKHKALINNEYL